MWTSALTLRFMEAFMLSDKTRELLAILTVSFRDCIPFVFITAGMMFSFAVIRQYQTFFDRDMNTLEEIGMIFAWALGDFDSPGTGKERK